MLPDRLWTVSRARALPYQVYELVEPKSATVPQSGIPKPPAPSKVPATVETLETLNAESAKTVYTPLGRKEIRMVKVHAGKPEDDIECSIFAVTEDEPLKYEALSYVWGSQDDSKMIRLNGMIWRITRNLHGALLRLRNVDESRLVWIDALAINQADISEKNVQVPKMQMIYSGASTTLVWLGPADNQHILETLQLADQLCKEGRSGLEDVIQSICWRDHARLAESLLSVGMLHYWQRVWIAQEIGYAQNAVLMYGDFALEYENLVALWKAMASVMGTNVREEVTQNITKDSHRYFTAWTTLNTFGPTTMPGCGSLRHGEYLTIDQWRTMVKSKMATDPKDKVFGFYGCFSQEIRDELVVDYSRTLPEIMTQMTKILLAKTNTLNSILYDHESSIAEVSQAPSWVWNPSASGVSSMAVRPDWQAGGNLPFFYNILDQDRVLHVKGKIIHVVQVVISSLVHPDAKADVESDPGLLVQFVMTHFFETWRAFGRPLDTRLFLLVVAYYPWGVKLLVSFLLVSFPWDLKTFGERLRPWVSEHIYLHHCRWLWDLIFRRAIMQEHLWETNIYHSRRCMFSCANSLDEVTLTYGLGPENILPRDRICIIQGCSVPLVLRLVNEHYVLIGHAIVSGIMTGDTAAGMESGEDEVEDFLIR